MKLTMKQARVGAGLTQEQMAERLGVTNITYFSYEKNPSKMRVDRLLKFSEVTGVDVSMLKLEGDNDRTAKMGKENTGSVGR